MTSNTTPVNSSKVKCHLKDKDVPLGRQSGDKPGSITIRKMEARGHLHGNNKWDGGEQSRGEDDQTVQERQREEMSVCVHFFKKKKKTSPELCC